MIVYDLFSGAGGFSLGFEMAGAKCTVMLEKDEWAFQTYATNRVTNNMVLINDDIKNIKLKDICSRISASPDLIIGGPPCQGFSTASINSRDFFDSRNELFVEFLKWVTFFRPKFFVIENVLGLTSKKDKSGILYKDIIIEKFKKIGYNISFWKLNALEYGVPQQRIRVFFVGSLLNKEIPSPPITHSFKNELKLNLPVTVSDALSDLPDLQSGEGKEIQEYDKKAQTKYQRWARKESSKVFNHVSMQHTERLVNRYKMIQEGCKIEELPNEFKVRKRGQKDVLSTTNFGLNYRLLLANKVSLTIPASFYSSFIHPFQPRNITTREAARLQSFPDNYMFYGKRTQMSNSYLKKKGITPNLSQYNQVGNAVPPLLAKAIAEHLMKLI